MGYYPSIGFEVHIELKTKSKMFCGCSADYFNSDPNTRVCPVCLGLPGALPIPNRKAIEWTILLGLALNCKINFSSKFDRKNYFYPDLAKGYQISQYDIPFCKNGFLQIPNSKIQIPNKSEITNSKTDIIRIERVHLEEDTAKLTHAVIEDGDVSLVDFNRSGVPLVEIVTRPDFHDIEHVKEYLKSIQRIVRYLGISDANMEKGTMRCEPSISLSKNPNTLANYRVEIKNINSFKFAERAISYEIKRQTELLDSGVTPEQETRGYDENKGITILQRSKENAEDYRYFPEPDIPRFVFTEDYIGSIKMSLPELPEAKQARYIRDFGLSEYEAEIITENREIAEKYEEIVSEYNHFVETHYNASQANRAGETQHVASLQKNNNAKEIAKLIINKKIDINSVVTGHCPVTTIIEDINKILQPVKSSVSNDEVEEIVKKVLHQNEKAVSDYKSGKTQVIGFLTGLCMRELKDKCDVKTVQKSIIKLI